MVSMNSKEYEDFQTYMVKVCMISGDDVDMVIDHYKEFQQGTRFDPDKMEKINPAVAQ